MIPAGLNLNRVEVAFRAVACLGDEDRGRFVARFNRAFGQCTPPLTLQFTSGTETPDGT